VLPHTVAARSPLAQPPRRAAAGAGAAAALLAAAVGHQSGQQHHHAGFVIRRHPMVGAAGVAGGCPIRMQQERRRAVAQLHARPRAAPHPVSIAVTSSRLPLGPGRGAGGLRAPLQQLGDETKRAAAAHRAHRRGQAAGLHSRPCQQLQELGVCAQLRVGPRRRRARRREVQEEQEQLARRAHGVLLQLVDAWGRGGGRAQGMGWG
jgi:hypothetical protein